MYEWLSGIVGENAARVAGFILLFLLILAAIVAVLTVIRRVTGGTFVAGGRGRAPRLSVMDAAAVDSRRRLVLVRRDDVEHLLLIGGPTDIVVEQNIQAARAKDRPSAAKTELAEPEPRAERPAPAAPVAEAQEAEPSLAPEPAPAAPAVAAPVSNPAPAARQAPPASVTPFPERHPERPRPTVAAVRPAPQPQQPAQSAQHSPAPAAARPVPQFSQPPRPAPVPPQPQSRTTAPQPAAPQPVRAHPAYPLSQVAQGVISATSGLAAASGSSSTAGLNVAPARETPQPRAETTPARTAPSFANFDQPEARAPRIEETSVTPFPSAPAAREDVSGKLDTFADDLHDSMFDELTLDEIQLDDEPSNELNISAAGHEPQDEAVNQLEDEMEKLLGELSRSRRN
ncbi:flagellar biosynthetic protein FliO [Brucella sp. IR073]|uniref:flagellar biosynthetic protein FliO n=1 Tax=unclassified Brucella TaxID=2632610 RepID=UPI003B97FFA5